MNIIYGIGRLQRLLHNNEYVGPPFFGVFFVISILRVEVEVNGLTENVVWHQRPFVFTKCCLPAFFACTYGPNLL